MERLEPRHLMAVDGIFFNSSTGALTINGTDYSDFAEARQVGNDEIRVRLREASSGNLQSMTLDIAQVTSIEFYGFAGDDVFNNGTGISSTAYGGADDDLLYGGSGADSLFGEGGSDVLKGNSSFLVTFVPSPVSQVAQSSDLLDGGDGDDRLGGSGGNDLLRGGNGNDYLEGRDGDDLLLGGEGHDTLRGDQGRDLLIGGGGGDDLMGGQGDDILIGGTTDYDGDSAALAQILSVWVGGPAYADRVTALEDSGFIYQLKSDQTVADDDVADMLWGEGENDWFFVTNWNSGDATIDMVKDAELGEIVSREASSGIIMAMQSGDWSNPATWGGLMPAAGRSVMVPEGIDVTYDLATPTAIDQLHIHGTLRFATNTVMRVDTIMVHGELEIGTADNAIHAEIRFTDGAIDFASDPELVSRGLLAHMGSHVSIFGEDKTPFVRAATGPAAGATSVALGTVPSNWQVGDTVLVTAADYRKFARENGKRIWQGSDDELRTITAINGAVVTFDTPLEFNHFVAGENVPIFVANMTRSVTFRSEGLEMNERAHSMYMTTDVYVSGAAFIDMGRTDKSDPITNNPTSGDDNMIARYPVHVHRTGPTNDALVFEKSVVMNSPGWGFVNHDSNVHLRDNVSYNVVGAHFVTERGNEAGSMTGNLAAVATGDTDRNYKNGREDESLETGDFGHQGHGFWNHSRNIVFENNAAVSTHDAAMIWFHRSNEMLVQVDVDTLLTDHKEIANGQDTIDFNRVPLVQVKNNIVVASNRGLQVVKARADQQHDVRNVIEGFEAYNVLTGVWLEYTSKYALNDIFVDADDQSSAGHGDWAFKFASNTQEVTINNALARDFDNGVFVSDHFVALGPDDTPDIVMVDVTLENVDQEFLWTNWETGATTDQPDPFLQKNLTASQLTNSGVSFSLGPNQSFSLSQDEGQFINGQSLLVIRGEKHDSAGDGVFRVMFRVSEIQDLAKELGYFHENGRDYVMMIGTVSDRVFADRLEHVTWVFDATGVANMLKGPQMTRAGLEAAHYNRLGLPSPNASSLTVANVAPATDAAQHDAVFAESNVSWPQDAATGIAVQFETMPTVNADVVAVAFEDYSIDSTKVDVDLLSPTKDDSENIPDGSSDLTEFDPSLGNALQELVYSGL